MKRVLGICLMVIALSLVVTAASFAAVVTPVSYSYIVSPYPDTASWADAGNSKLTDGAIGDLNDLFAGWPNVWVGFDKSVCDVVFDFGESIDFTSVSSVNFYHSGYTLLPPQDRNIAVSDTLDGEWSFSHYTLPAPPDVRGSVNTTAFTGTGRYLRIQDKSSEAWLTTSEYTFEGTSSNPPVPEPGSLLALSAGLTGMAGFMIRRRK